MPPVDPSQTRSQLFCIDPIFPRNGTILICFSLYVQRQHRLHLCELYHTNLKLFCALVMKDKSCNIQVRVLRTTVVITVEKKFMFILSAKVASSRSSSSPRTFRPPALHTKISIFPSKKVPASLKSLATPSLSNTLACKYSAKNRSLPRVGYSR